MDTFFVIVFLALTSYSVEAKRVVCYHSSSAVVRETPGKFEIEDIDPTLCTHLIYGFVGIEGNHIKIVNPQSDLPDNYGLNGFSRFNALRRRNPNLRTMISIKGGLKQDSRIAELASTPKFLANFVRNVVGFVKRYNFDGVDFYWSFPDGNRENPPVYYDDGILFRSLRIALERERLLLSATVGGSLSTRPKSHAVAEVFSYLHFVNLKTFNFYGGLPNETYLNAPLYGGPGSGVRYSVDDAVKYFLSHNVPPEKLNLGIPFFGRLFTLASPSNRNYIGAPVLRPDDYRYFSRRRPNYLAYNDICAHQKSTDWNIRYNQRGSVAYAFLNDQWVSYDDPSAVAWKAAYIKKMELGGAMIWRIDADDFRGDCDRRYPLLRTLNRNLRFAASDGNIVAVDDSGIKAKQKIQKHKEETTSNVFLDLASILRGTARYFA